MPAMEPGTRLLTDDEFFEIRQQLLGQRVPVLSNGGVTLIAADRSERFIVDAARTTSNVKGKGDKEDRGLLRYLMRHRHTTPFEFVNVTFLLEMPMDAWRQHIRHRMSHTNEFSSRYSEVPDINDTTASTAWRLQSTSNRQGSSAAKLDAEQGAKLSAREAELHKLQREVYEERLALGIAKEQARKDLCLSTYTRAYWQSDLHNLLHYLSLRMDPHAQLEIRMYANVMFDIVQRLFPVTASAFLDFRFNAMTLSGPEVAALRQILHAYGCDRDAGATVPADVPSICESSQLTGREREEFLAKWSQLVRG